MVYGPRSLFGVWLFTPFPSYAKVPLMNEKRIYNLEKQWAKADADAEDAALSSLLASFEGRKFLWKLLRIGGVGRQPFTSNALTTSFNCGELNVGQQILDHIISVDPAGYVRMMKEQADERTERAKSLADARAGVNGEYGADDSPDD